MGLKRDCDVYMQALPCIRLERLSKVEFSVTTVDDEWMEKKHVESSFGKNFYE
jgi:hypothetical protein